MNAIFNKVVVTMLSKYLQYYMNDFSRESFKLQIMKGTFDLEDMEINCQFLKDTVVLPNLEITDCLCNKLYLYIPWSNLGTEPITFDLDTINMTLVEIPPGERPQFEVKTKRVKPSSYGFVQRTIDGVKLSVKHVNITLKLNGYRNNPSIAKIKTSNIKIYSCGPDWWPVDLKESFVADKKKSEVVFYKVLECGSLEVAFADLSPDRKNADEPPEYSVVMKDIPVKIRCKVLKDITDGHVICGAFDLVLENMEMSFSDWQWKAFLELIKSLISCFTRTDQEYVFYKDIGKAYQDDSDSEDEEGEKREKKPPPKAKSWFGGWGEGSKEKKELKEKEKADKEKHKRMEEWGMRSKLREELIAAGNDPSDLDLEETTFNIYIDKGCLNMLNDEDANCDDPAFHSFARLHFEDMKAIFTLPPSYDVPVNNKWTDSDPKRKLLCEAILEMKHMALVLQEKIEKGKSKKSQERKQVVLVTDGRSESLKVKAAKHTKKKKKKEKKKEKKAQKKGDEKKSKKKASQKKDKITPFSLCKWEIVTNAPQELDMAKWLKSLDAQMKINVYESHLLMLHQWWARIERYLETASAGSKNIQALSLMKLTVALHVVGNYMTLPLTMSNELVVPSMEEVLAAPHLMLHSTRINAGKKALEKGTKALFDSVKIKEKFEGEAKDKRIVDENEKEQESKLRDVKIVGFGNHKNGWTSQELVRKPQRYECLFENMSLSIADRKILNPIDFEFELALHRYETTEQLLLELCARAQVLQLHLSRSEYLMFLHFTENVLNSVWMEIILVLQRRYGPDRFQKKLAEMGYHDLAVSEEMMPIVVNTFGFIDYMVVSLNKEKTKHDDIFFADEKEPPKDSGLLAELHLVDLKTKSYNTDLYKTGYYEKSVTCSKLTALVPPEGGSKGEGFELSGKGEGESKLKIAELDGKIFSSEAPYISSVLKSNNSKVFNQLRGADEDAGHGVGAGSSFVTSEKVSLEVDGDKQTSLPTQMVAFLNDVFNV